MLYHKARTSMPRSSATTTRPPAQASLQQRQAGRNVMALGARRRRIPQVEAATIEHLMAIDDVEKYRGISIALGAAPISIRRAGYVVYSFTGDRCGPRLCPRRYAPATRGVVSGQPFADCMVV